jgi:ATP-dependent helicase HrpB
MVHGRRGTLARESVVHHAPLLVAADVREISGRDGALTTLLSLATAIEPDWIEADFPHDLTRTCQVSYDAAARRVLAEDQLQFRGLTLLARPRPQPPEEEAARLLAREVLAGRLPLPAWDHAVDQWILRLNHLVRVCPELGLPPLLDTDREDLITQVCLGAFSFKDLKDRPVRPVVQDWLSPQQQTLLDRHVPERLELANHRRPKITYVADGPPFFALRIQELFGIQDTPRVALGRSPVTVHILAPSMRPVQVTQDLARFWTEHYPRVKSELQRKYPKHEWR